MHGAPVGDTLTQAREPAPHPLPGFQKMQPRVFAGLFPVVADDYPAVREALDKLKLNDAALYFEPETSEAMGFGFRCGFLGLLHMDIVQERLEREYDLNLISTAPTVVYEVLQTDGTILSLDNPAKLPPAQNIEEIREPIIVANILTPPDYVGNVITLCEEKRGVQRSIHYLATQVQISYELPLAEVVLDFFDKLKSVSRGYASMDYHFERFEAGPFVRLDVLINGERVDALSLIVHRSLADRRGRELVERMSELIPRQQFDVAIQAAIGAQVIARSTVKALRKNVLAKCYGGDVSRKRKLLEKQKEGKKRMKQVGRVEIPQEAFLAVLQVGQQVAMLEVRDRTDQGMMMNFDFALLLVILTGVTGVLWLADRLLLLAARRRRAAALENMTSLPAAERKTRAEEALREPVVTEYARSFFPVLLLILLFRSFLAEPFKIPSGSMMPTLLVGDFILVNKFAYGLRLPVLNTKILSVGEPKRGDVFVFRYPREPERGLHQARDRPAGRRDHLPQQDALHQRQGDSGELSRALYRADRAGQPDDRRAGQARAAGGRRPPDHGAAPVPDRPRGNVESAGWLLLRDGR